MANGRKRQDDARRRPFSTREFSAEEIRAQADKLAPRFIAAAKRAQQQLAEEAKVPPRLPRRSFGWALAGAAVVGVVVVGTIYALSTLGLLQLVKVAEAEEFRGIRGLVISSHDRSPLPGIVVTAQLELGSNTPEFAAITDAQGMFELPPDERGARRLYFIHEGNSVGELLAGGDDGVHGYIEIPIDVAPIRDVSRYEINIQPGERLEVYAGLKVSLDAEAEQPWSGELVHDLQWPANFVFGKVLAGIFQLEGAACSDLKIELEIDAALPRMYQFDPAEMKLVSYSKEYENHDDEWRAAHHQGWYAANLLTDDHVNKFDIERVALDISSNESNSTTVAWSANPGQPYALLSPVLRDGKIVACVLNSTFSGMPVQGPAICLIDSTWPQPWLYDPLYTLPGCEIPYTKAGYLERGTFRYPLDQEWSINHMVNPEPEGLRLLEENEYRELLGALECKRHDFTLSNPQMYAVDTSNLSLPLGTYDIETKLTQVGEKATLRIVGDTDLLAQPPRWDFNIDGVLDSYGLEANLLIPHPGVYYFQVFLQELDGPHIVLQRALVRNSAEYLGYFKWKKYAEPVMLGAIQLPVKEHTHRALSLYAATSPMAYGNAVSSHLGPWLLISPPPDWAGTRLKELRIHYTVRAANAGALTMAIHPHVYAVEIVPSNAINDHPLAFLALSGLPPYCDDSGKIDINDNGWWPYHAVQVADNPANHKSPREIVKSEIMGSDTSRAIIKELFGIDLHNLPADDDLVAILRPWVESPYCGIHYCDYEYEHLASAVDLYELTLQENQGFLINYFAVDGNMPVAGQWDVYTGGDNLSRVELEAVDGRIHTVYFDYSQL